MNTINFACILLLTFLLPFGLFASAVKWFFTTDELIEMGIHSEPTDTVEPL